MVERPSTDTPTVRDQLGPSLTVAFATATAVAALIPLAGGYLAAVVAAIGVLALAGARYSSKVAKETVLGPYVTTIVATLVADTLRFAGQHISHIESLFGTPLANHLDGQRWFAGFVVVPVTVMLLGGYLLGRDFHGAPAAGWWTAGFALADGLLCLVALAANGASAGGWDYAAAAASLVQLLSATVLVQRLLAKSRQTDTRLEHKELTLRQRNLWTVLIVTVVAGYGLALQQQAGLLPVGVIVGSMMGGLVGWRRTTARVPANPAYHVPLLLLMLALFYIHVGEESLTHFNNAIADISGTPWSDRPFTILIGIAGPAVWVLGAWSLWHRQPFGNFVYWFLLVGMVLGEPTHLVVFPVMRMVQDDVGYGYFSGMYTALFPMVPAILALRAIRSQKRVRT